MRGFSLVELSIVLVILGLITGGILTGKSLVRSAQLRAITTEAQQHRIAFESFRDQYMAVPGDFSEASRLWGRNEAACPAATGTDKGAAGACNGNGNDRLSVTITANFPSEIYQYWHHLSLAGLIEGTYTGLSGPLNYAHTLSGTNSVPSRLPKAVWLPNVTQPGATDTFGGTGTNTLWGVKTMPAKNYLTLGIPGASNWALGRILKPKEAFNLDSKIDDGKPTSGKMLPSGCTWGSTLCMVDQSGNPSTADCNAFHDVAQYNLSNTTLACTMLFELP